ncbi:hypothetical protein NliqN6_0004 [Naganishia liquefaciens]|uniref:Alpha/beta hydrolase fold-3 domain-containing protein n=1 Tax=Naganishia liquefaciens TaxID=104408 RepID=A0A8H3TM60_9TREE|nr:hypothetical protein NliqN6_0004 [Naganishia liquefaciens]
MSAYVDPPPGIITNARAPSSLPRVIATPLALISTVAYVAVLAPYLAYQTLSYYTIGPPWPGWTLGTMLFARGLGLLLQFMYRFGLPQADRRAWGVPIGAKRKGVNVERRRIQGLPTAQEEELRIGWAKQKDVKVVDVPGFMLSPESGNTPSNAHQPSKVTGTGYARANEGEKIVYYLVGGGYIGGHPLRTHLAWTTAQQLNVRVFAVNYRKSLTAETAFPACLLDALAGYLFLTRDLGFLPSNIILMGDSAGGNLALGLARYLAELADRSERKDLKEIGQVGGMILYSDYCGSFGTSGLVSHTRHFHKHLAANPYFSPALPTEKPRFQHLVEGSVKVYIQTGTAEILYDEDVALAKAMHEEGVNVRLRELEGEIHAAILFERTKAMRASEKDIPEFWHSLD